MRVLVKKAGKEEPEIREIQNELHELKSIVGGYIEVVEISPNVVMVCNEEGKLQNLQPNLIIFPYDIIVGDVFFVRTLGEDFTDLSDTDIASLRMFIRSTLYSELKAALIGGNKHE
jgi:hypothetical protein